MGAILGVVLEALMISDEHESQILSKYIEIYQKQTISSLESLDTVCQKYSAVTTTDRIYIKW